ncbi:MAG: hypothetical protein L0228_20685 [Planctomycetes bacterium]|nr:hypothetical protein [Planctomycetota bacterium]
MKMSFMTINRLLEEEMATDDNLRAVVERQGKVLLCEGRELSDAQLVEKFAGWGTPIDRATFEQMSRPFLSAQEMSEQVTKTCRSQIVEGSHDEDWLWVALVCLWERWLPDRPNFEMIDDQMQEGYRASAEDKMMMRMLFAHGRMPGGTSYRSSTSSKCAVSLNSTSGLPERSPSLIGCRTLKWPSITRGVPTQNSRKNEYPCAGQ